MQKHNVKRLHKNKTSAQVGRGGTRGKTSGRGTKGQNARAGHKNRPELRDFIKRLPKLRGRGKNSNLSIQNKPIVLSLSRIAGVCDAGVTVTPQVLIEHKLITIYKGKIPSVKILSSTAKAPLTKKLSFSGFTFSATAQAEVEKLGGKIVV